MGEVYEIIVRETITPKKVRKEIVGTLIRCKDCKWKAKHNCTRAVELWIDDDKFCAWAERKEKWNN